MALSENVLFEGSCIFKTIFESIPTPCAVIKYDKFEIIACNASFSDMCGKYKALYADGMSILDSIPLNDSDSFKKMLDKVKINRCSATLEVQITDDFMNARFVPFEFGQAQYCYICFQDVSGVKKLVKNLSETEFKLSAILDNLPFMAWLKDTEGRFLDVNAEFVESCKMPKEDIIGKTDTDIYPHNAAEKFIADDLKAIKTGNKVYTEESIPDYRGGKWFETFKTPVFDDEGNIIGTTGMAKDVTAFKELEDELISAKNIAESASRSKSMFLANMSHEIRTPLNGILGFLQLMETTQLTYEQSEFVKNMRVSSMHLKNIINSILDVAKIETKGVELEKFMFNLRTAIEDAVIPFTADAMAKNLDVSLFIHNEIPEKVCGDSTKLKQVITNILSNSIKFTEKGSVRIDASLGNSDNDKFEIIFKIKDTGIGIPQNDIEKLFTPFAQSDKTSAGKYGGSGLGLSIAKAITEAMNGKIRIKSKVGFGTTFTFNVWINKAFDANCDADSYDATQILENSPYALLKDKRVMLIGDNSVNNMIIKSYFTDAEVIVAQAHTGSDAISVLVKYHDGHAYDAVIITDDIDDIKPYELLGALKSISVIKSIPFIFVYSRNSGDAAKPHAFDFNSKILKPFRKSDLIDGLYYAMKSYLDIRKDSAFADADDDDDDMDADAQQMLCPSEDCDFKILCAANDSNERSRIVKHLSDNGFKCSSSENGKEAVMAFASEDYDIIIMDNDMPLMNGTDAAKQIRQIESNVKHTPIILLDKNPDAQHNNEAFKSGIDEIIQKPINHTALTEIIKKYFMLTVLSANKRGEKASENAIGHITGYPRKRQKVMIVDDAPTNLNLLKIALESDYDISVVTNGADAISEAKSSRPPDIILLDIMMPGMDGYEVFTKLGESPKTRDIPVVFLTAVQDNENEEYGLTLGAIDYIKKPFNIPIVKTKLKNHLDLKRYEDFLKENSFIDPLTQIPNRRRFDETLSSEIKKAKRTEAPLSLLIMDIDFFKPYNDTYGHLQGDECLRKVAKEIKRTLGRPADLAARWGGEEFTCLLPETDSKGALKVAERIRRSIEQLEIVHEASLVSEYVTISIGVVTSHPVSDKRTKDELVKCADEALYKAKRTGRNKICLWKNKA